MGSEQIDYLGLLASVVGARINRLRPLAAATVWQEKAQSEASPEEPTQKGGGGLGFKNDR